MRGSCDLLIQCETMLPLFLLLRLLNAFRHLLLVQLQVHLNMQIDSVTLSPELSLAVFHTQKKRKKGVGMGGGGWGAGGGGGAVVEDKTTE